VLDRAWPARGRSLAWGGDLSGAIPARSFDGYTYSMVHPQGDLEQPVLNPLDYNITQSRFGLGEYGSAFNAVQPRCSSYEPHDVGSATAPAPAPAPRGASAGPSRYGYPSTSARRQTLTRHYALRAWRVDALRQKLEGKNQQMEQRDQRIERLEKELASAKGEVSERNEQIQQSDHRTSQLMGRIDGLETSLRDKEAELDKAKIRLLSHPDVIKEKEMKDRIESMTLEKKRLQDHIDQLRRNSEKERMEQQETYQAELRQLRCNVENLQKELADRDVLLESQNEKIGDMDRELAASKQRLQAAITDKGVEELHREVEFFFE
ncbi:hypothetical protein TELCIR_14702, partial [Teladorsagia circumcincta]